MVPKEQLDEGEQEGKYLPAGEPLEGLWRSWPLGIAHRSRFHHQDACLRMVVERNELQELVPPARLHVQRSFLGAERNGTAAYEACQARSAPTRYCRFNADTGGGAECRGNLADVLEAAGAGQSAMCITR